MTTLKKNHNYNDICTHYFCLIIIKTNGKSGKSVSIIKNEFVFPFMLVVKQIVWNWYFQREKWQIIEIL